MKKLSLVVLLSCIALTLSWCVKVEEDNDFDKNLKCYELWKDFIKEHSESQWDSHFALLNYSLYSKHNNTCIVKYTDYPKVYLLEWYGTVQWGSGMTEIIDLFRGVKIADDDWKVTTDRALYHIIDNELTSEGRKIQAYFWNLWTKD